MPRQKEGKLTLAINPRLGVESTPVADLVQLGLQIREWELGFFWHLLVMGAGFWGMYR